MTGKGGTNEKENPNQLYPLERRASSSRPPCLPEENGMIPGKYTSRQPLMRHE
jgi:hypothetical protein